MFCDIVLEMSLPSVFYSAFLLGINWSWPIGSFKAFLIYGFVVTVFVLPVILFQLFADMKMSTSVVFAVSFFRCLITWSYVVMGVVRCKLDDKFFEKALASGILQKEEDGVFPQEVILASYGSVASFFTPLASSFLILTMPLVVVMLFVFYCHRVF